MKKSGRLLSILLAVMMVLSLMPTGALAAKTPIKPQALYYDGNYYEVFTDDEVGTDPGQWWYQPLETAEDTIGWIWYVVGTKDQEDIFYHDSLYIPEQIEIGYQVFDGYQNVNMKPGADSDGEYALVTLKYPIADVSSNYAYEDYGTARNFFITFKEDYTFTQYGSFSAMAASSKEGFDRNEFAGCEFDPDGGVLTWKSNNGNQPGYIRINTSVQTRDPDHIKTIMDDDTVQLTVTGLRNTRNVKITFPLSDDVDFDESRDVKVVITEGTDAAFNPNAVTITKNGRTLTANFGSYVLKDGVTYAVQIPLIPSEEGLDQAMYAAGPYMCLPVNVDNGATLTWDYDLASKAKTQEYYEEPEMAIPNTDAADIRVVHEWADGAANHASDVVTVGIYRSGSTTALTTAELNAANGFEGTFSGLGSGNSFQIKVEKIVSKGKDVTARYTTDVVTGESSGVWKKVDAASVQNNRSSNLLYAITYTYNGGEYLFTNKGTRMTSVNLASVPVTVTNGMFKESDIGAAIGSENLASWNHMQWMVLSANDMMQSIGKGTWENTTLLYNFGSERYLSMDSFGSAYTFSMNSSFEGSDVMLDMSNGAASGNTFFKMYMNASLTSWGWFKAQELPVPNSAGTKGYGLSTSTASDAAQFKFYEYQPGELTYTLTSTATAVPETYTVTWKNEDGTVLKTDELEAGALPAYDGATPTKAPDAQYTYTFKGWTPAITSVTGAATYTAEFEQTVNQYTVKFVNADGTELQSGKVAYGAMPVYNGATPTKAADTDGTTYSFKGWDKALAAVTGDATYTAMFESHAPVANTVKLNVTNYTKNSATVTVNGVSKTDQEASFDVNANASVTMTVSADKACAVGLLQEDGSYLRLKGVKSGSGYSFTIPASIEDVTMVVGYKGDANLDGNIKAGDASMILRNYAGTYELDAVHSFFADASGDGSIKAGDSSMTLRAYAGIFTMKWDV